MKSKNKLIFAGVISGCMTITGITIAVPPPIFQTQEEINPQQVYPLPQQQAYPPSQPQQAYPPSQQGYPSPQQGYPLPQYQELYYPPVAPDEYSEPTVSNVQEEITVDHGASFLELLQELEEQKPSLPKISHKGVVLKGLDKVTARTLMLDLEIDQQGIFNTLLIKTKACQKNSPEEKPETAAYLEIDEKEPDGTIKRVFAGWMLASSPALSALDHPIYDIWVVDCKTDSTTSDSKAITPEKSGESGKN